MKMVPMRCPQCNGDIEAEEGMEFIYCMYCGTKIYIDYEKGKTDVIIHREINDAEIQRVISEERTNKRRINRDREYNRQVFLRDFFSDLFDHIPPVAIGVGIYALVIGLIKLVSNIFRHFDNYRVAGHLNFAIYLMIALPIIGFISYLIAEHGGSITINKSNSSWFGFRKESEEHEIGPAGIILIIWLLFIGGTYLLMDSFYKPPEQPEKEISVDIDNNSDEDR